MGTGDDSSDVVLLLNESEIRGLIDEDAAFEVCREGFAALARGEVQQPAPLSFEFAQRSGEMHAKGAQLGDAPYYSVKFAASFYENPERGLPVASGAVVVFDAETGRPRALLFDNAFLSHLRTGAAGALAADLLAAPTASKVGIIGAGGQARYQLRALLGVRSIGQVKVWGRTRERTDAFVAEMSEFEGVDIEAVDSPGVALAGADIVITATPAREAVVTDDMVEPGVHITAVGADFPGKFELSPALLGRSKVVADRLAQCQTQGEIANAASTEEFSIDDVHAELGEIVIGERPGRTDESEITIADLTGVGALDAAVANLVTERALANGIGERFSP